MDVQAEVVRRGEEKRMEEDLVEKIVIVPIVPSASNRQTRPTTWKPFALALSKVLVRCACQRYSRRQERTFLSWSTR
jgi:hypothetical protein